MADNIFFNDELNEFEKEIAESLKSFINHDTYFEIIDSSFNEQPLITPEVQSVYQSALNKALSKLSGNWRVIYNFSIRRDYILSVDAFVFQPSLVMTQESLSDSLKNNSEFSRMIADYLIFNFNLHFDSNEELVNYVMSDYNFVLKPILASLGLDFKFEEGMLFVDAGSVDEMKLVDQTLEKEGLTFLFKNDLPKKI